MLLLQWLSSNSAVPLASCLPVVSHTPPLTLFTIPSARVWVVHTPHSYMRIPRPCFSNPLQQNTNTSYPPSGLKPRTATQAYKAPGRPRTPGCLTRLVAGDAVPPLGDGDDVRHGQDQLLDGHQRPGALGAGVHLCFCGRPVVFMGGLVGVWYRHTHGRGDLFIWARCDMLCMSYIDDTHLLHPVHLEMVLVPPKPGFGIEARGEIVPVPEDSS